MHIHFYSEEGLYEEDGGHSYSERAHSDLSPDGEVAGIIRLIVHLSIVPVRGSKQDAGPRISAGTLVVFDVDVQRDEHAERDCCHHCEDGAGDHQREVERP